MIANNPCPLPFRALRLARRVVVFRWPALYGNPSRRGKFPRRSKSIPKVADKR
jgi:hypothetical protein